MSASSPIAGTAVFTPGEREYIRRELDQFFSTLPSVADGFQLRTWRGGPQAGQPKVPLAGRGLLDRGLMRLQATPWPPRLFFPQPGLAALRAMMADRRLANPKTFAHVRQELASTRARRSRSPGPPATSSLSRCCFLPCPALKPTPCIQPRNDLTDVLGCGRGLLPKLQKQRIGPSSSRKATHGPQAKDPAQH